MTIGFRVGPQNETLPEAQRTQGIDSITWVVSAAKNNANSIEKKIQVKEAIPWVRCAFPSYNTL